MNEEKKAKEKLIVMSCTWKIRLSPNKNKKKEVKKNDEKKLHKYK